MGLNPSIRPCHFDCMFPVGEIVYRRKKWRGADCYDKVLTKAAKDPRSIINYTISSQNIDEIQEITRDCADHGVNITFQVYSPTNDYLDYLSGPAANDHTYIQSGDKGDNLILTAADEKRAERAICDAIDAFPETVVFTKPLARWLFASPIRFPNVPLDGRPPKGCEAGHNPQHQHRLVDGTLETRKTCGHPSVDCSTCRVYTAVYPSFLAEHLKPEMTRQDAIDFLDVHHVFDVLFIGRQGVEWPPAKSDDVTTTAMRAL